MKLSQRFEQALIYAGQVHADQQRKGSGTPYIAHLLGTASLTLEYGGDEDQAIAALLHDAPEDQGGRERLEEIRAQFGERVAHIVEGCTDSWVKPKPPWRERKEKYIRHLPEAGEDVLLVSCCDKLYNTRAILRDLRRLGPAVWERFNGKRDGTLWYYRTLVETYRRITDMEVVEELARAVRALEALADEMEGGKG